MHPHKGDRSFARFHSGGRWRMAPAGDYVLQTVAKSKVQKTRVPPNSFACGAGFSQPAKRSDGCRTMMNMARSVLRVQIAAL